LDQIVPVYRDLQQSSATPGQTWQQARHHAMTRSGELGFGLAVSRQHRG
jgi:hypothetical protein